MSAELIIRNPRWYEQHIKETVCYVTWSSYTSEIWIFEVIFVVFRLMKKIFLIKTKRFVGRKTIKHACQIYSSEVTENIYHCFVLLEITMVKIMNNLNLCSTHSYLYPRSRFKLILYHTSIEIFLYLYIINTIFNWRIAILKHMSLMTKWRYFRIRDLFLYQLDIVNYCFVIVRRTRLLTVFQIQTYICIVNCVYKYSQWLLSTSVHTYSCIHLN